MSFPPTASINLLNPFFSIPFCRSSLSSNSFYRMSYSIPWPSVRPLPPPVWLSVHLLPSVLHAVWLDHVLVTCQVLIVEYPVATSLSLLHLPPPPPLMTKSKAKAGVSRQVKFLQLGPQGQPQTMILKQSVLTRRHEAAAKVQLDILQGMCQECYQNSVLCSQFLLTL